MIVDPSRAADCQSSVFTKLVSSVFSAIAILIPYGDWRFKNHIAPAFIHSNVHPAIHKRNAMLSTPLNDAMTISVTIHDANRIPMDPQYGNHVPRLPYAPIKTDHVAGLEFIQIVAGYTLSVMLTIQFHGQDAGKP